MDLVKYFQGYKGVAPLPEGINPATWMLQARTLVHASCAPARRCTLLWLACTQPASVCSAHMRAGCSRARERVPGCTPPVHDLNPRP